MAEWVTVVAPNAQHPQLKQKAEKKEVKADAKPTESSYKGEKKETKAAQTGK